MLQAVGYEDDPTDTTTTSNVSTEKGTGQPGLYSSYNQGSGPSTQGAGTAGGTLSAAELPKSGVVNTGPGGSADVTAKQQPGYIASAAGACLWQEFDFMRSMHVMISDHSFMENHHLILMARFEDLLLMMPPQ